MVLIDEGNSHDIAGTVSQLDHSHLASLYHTKIGYFWKNPKDISYAFSKTELRLMCGIYLLSIVSTLCLKKVLITIATTLLKYYNT